MSGATCRAKLGTATSGCNVDRPERVHSRPVDHVPDGFGVYDFMDDVAELSDPHVHGICEQFYGVVGLHRLLSRHSSSSTSNSGSVPIYPHLWTGCCLNRTSNFLVLVIRALARLSVAGPLLNASSRYYS